MVRARVWVCKVCSLPLCLSNSNDARDIEQHLESHRRATVGIPPWKRNILRLEAERDKEALKDIRKAARKRKKESARAQNQSAIPEADRLQTR